MGMTNDMAQEIRLYGALIAVLVNGLDRVQVCQDAGDGDKEFLSEIHTVLAKEIVSAVHGLDDFLSDTGGPTLKEVVELAHEGAAKIGLALHPVVRSEGGAA